MVTFARNRKYCACETTASVNQGETGSMGANGPQSVCPKEHIFALSDERTIEEISCFYGSAEESAVSKVHAFPSIPTKILLPIDFSSSSQAALEMAADLAKHFHAELHLVNVIPMFPTTTLPDVFPKANSFRKPEHLRSNIWPSAMQLLRPGE